MLDELPNDAHEIVDILRAEAAPLNLWLRFAVRANAHPTSASFFGDS